MRNAVWSICTRALTCNPSERASANATISIRANDQHAVRLAVRWHCIEFHIVRVRLSSRHAAVWSVAGDEEDT